MEKCTFIYLSVILCVVYNTAAQNPNITARKQFIYDVYNYDEIISVEVNSSTEHILDFYEQSNKLRGYPTRVHVSSNDTINGEYPLFITATQQKGVSSWEIPLVVQTVHSRMQFNNMARTLCPHDAGPNITTENRPTLSLATSNPRNVSVAIKLKRVQDFYVEVNNGVVLVNAGEFRGDCTHEYEQLLRAMGPTPKSRKRISCFVHCGREINLTVTPSTPKYFYFSFDQDPWNKTLNYFRFNYTIPKSVIVIIESDEDICAVVSIQNNSCPVFDNEEDMLYQGYHLTMTTKGGITLTQSQFPVGFYIVLIVRQSDSDCLGQTTVRTDVSATSRIKHFRFRVIATISYKEYVVGALVMLVATLLVALFGLLVYIPSCQWSEQVVVVEEIIPSTSSGNPDAVPIMSDENPDSDVEAEFQGRSVMPSTLTLAETSRAPTRTTSRRSNRYFWSALTVAVVYALPVVQLLSTYQHMVFQTGNQDLCYYNFLCAHPLGFLSDFNHVYSNITYVVLGLVFMMQVRSRQVASKNNPQDVGIPEHHGLFYSMGLALVMEGFLSACYHLCPNKMNFQFDSSFMYVIAVLCMVKLYQNRHPDVNASAHSTFLLLAFIMALGVYGIMYPSVYFWVLFTALHLAACFALTMNIYYVGRFKLDRSLGPRAWSRVRAEGRRAFVPGYPARAVLLAVANVANWALAAFGLYQHNKDFARHLLAILMGNTTLYTLFYVCMKVIHREKVMVHTWLYLILAHVAWFTALRFFLDSNTKWSQTPAHSRKHNRECTVLQFYDSHDVWHAASAAALYLSFRMLLTVDDAIARKPRRDLPVF